MKFLKGIILLGFIFSLFVFSVVIEIINSQLLDIMLKGIILFIIYMVFIIVKFNIRLKYFSALEKEYKYELLLKELDKDLSKLKKQYGPKITLMMFKSKILNHKGEFKESLQVLYSIILENVYMKKYKQTYYELIILNLLMLNKLDSAKTMYDMYLEKIKQEKLKKPSKAFLAIYKFYMGNINESKKMFEDLLNKKNISEKNNAYINYYLGLIDLKEGKFEEGKNKLEKVSSFKKEHFITEKAKKILEETFSPLSNLNEDVNI
ncbi:tetratricopeptide repeat protein [Tepidibacter thalassicus]|uniref:Tetratricopeptide repeat-containing protein n=1 Tax=Tepidibacter thalassicus DSM 15285 TaxID=1123350 RepID=A0A1M5SV25_9FIRM|nr:hypothetical protein [Tepidibacter thalassicus]SHH41843.1 hypothetical protein SAMN02744040_01897 [Tepidibacter thalassicus DSM 15285]